MDFWIIILIPLPAYLLLIYYYIEHKYSYWTRQGIPGPKPSLLSFGNIWSMFARDPYEHERDSLAKYGKVYGTYQGLRPVLAVADAELIKLVMVKDFHLFVDQHEVHTSHPIVNRIVFLESSPNWKRLRTITTPCFSSGKLKLMFGRMDKSVDELVTHLDEMILTKNGLIKDVRQMMVSFSLDVIASNVFGLQTNSMKDLGHSNVSNPFLRNALKVFDLSSFKFFGTLAFPTWLNDILGIRHNFNDESWNFFEKLSKEILRQRRETKEQSGKRNDLIELLINAQMDESKFKDDNSSYDKLNSDFNNQEGGESASFETKNTKSVLSEEEIIAQAIGFMIGGLESVVTTLTFCVYELVLNPMVQARLHDELSQMLSDKAPNSVAYNETVMQLPYLDAVIKETLRKYPSFTRWGRRFGGSLLHQSTYKLGDTGVVLQKGMLVEFPSFSLHYNPEYFPEPNRFEPDRFLPENKDKLVPYSYIPFGHGPRNCIGMRFANQTMKLCLAKICRHFRFCPTAKTPTSAIPFLPFKITLGTSVQIEVKVVREMNFN